MKIAQRFLKTPVVKAAVLIGCAFNVAVILAFGWMNTNMEYFFNPLKILGEKMIVGFSGPENSELEKILVKDERLRVIRFTNNDRLFSSLKLGSVLDAGVVHEGTKDRVNVYLPEKQDNRIPIISNILKHNLTVFEDFKRKETLQAQNPQQAQKLVFLNEINSPTWHYPGAGGMFEAFFTFIIPLLFLAPGFVCGYIVLEQLHEEKRTGTYNLLLTAVGAGNIFRQLLFASFVCCALINAAGVVALSQKLLAGTNATGLFVLGTLASTSLCAVSLKSALSTQSVQNGKTVLFCGFFILMVPLAFLPSSALSQLSLGVVPRFFGITCALLLALVAATVLTAPENQEQT